MSILVALSCVGYDAGIDVDVDLVSPRATVGNGVASATLLIEDAELLPCEGNAGVAIQWGFAYAHGSDVSADIVDILQTPRRLYMTLRPPPDEYCTLRLHLGDPERDAAALTRTTDVGVQTLNAPRQDVDIAMSPRSYHEPGQHQLVLRYDYTRWIDDLTFASSFSVE